MKLTLGQINRLRKKNPEALRRYHKNQSCSHKWVADGICRNCRLEVDKKGVWKGILPDGITIGRHTHDR